MINLTQAKQSTKCIFNYTKETSTRNDRWEMSNRHTKLSKVISLCTGVICSDEMFNNGLLSHFDQYNHCQVYYYLAGTRQNAPDDL